MTDYEDIKNCADDIFDIINSNDKFVDSLRDVCLRLADFKYLIIDKYSL